jgi:hypothetical protein
LFIQYLLILNTINLDSAINLAQNTLDEAQNLKYYRGEVELLTNLLSNYSFKANFEVARQKFNQLEQTTPGK